MKYYETDIQMRPIIPLRGMTVFPNMVVHFDVLRDKSIEALEQASMDESKIFLTTQHEALIEDPKEDEFYHYGVVAVIKQMVKLSGGVTRVLVEGVNRARILEFNDTKEYISGIVEEYIYSPDKLEITNEIEAKTRLIKENFREYVNLNDRILPEELLTIDEIKDPSRVTDLISSLINLETEKAQTIIETLDVETRMEKLYKFFNEEIEILEIKSGIEEKVNEHMQEVQKEYYLKEQMKVIRDELGDSEDIDDEVNKYIEDIKAIGLDEEDEEKVIKEAQRLLKMSPYSAEVGIIRTYLDWILELPWSEERESKIDISRAKDILNEDHYGLEDVKERILEFIAVKKLTDQMQGPILCLVGPPGVGKTSIARSIARALDKDFVRMSLGGVRDEAEIRGHRRTYVGAMPGKIISSISKAGSSNPVFLLDEIDKIASGSDSGQQQVSREGVQRDILPIVEGSVVRTKYGNVRTDYMLFIGSGAFHMATPSDLIPELQGRFPIRVELNDLTADDFVKILTEPRNSLVKQYQALLATENIDVVFTMDAIEEMANIAQKVNEETDNIGARRLHTILEKLLEELLFEASDIPMGEIKITKEYVNERIGHIAKDQDLSHYIL